MLNRAQSIGGVIAIEGVITRLAINAVRPSVGIGKERIIAVAAAVKAEFAAANIVVIRVIFRREALAFVIGNE